MSVYAGLLECFGVRLRIAAEGSPSSASAIGWIEFAAAVTDEHELYVLLESRRIRDVGRSDAAAAENADVRELVEISQADRSGLHAAHGEPCQSAVWLICHRAIRVIHPGDQVINEDPLECGEIKHSTCAWRRGVR